MFKREIIVGVVFLLVGGVGGFAYAASVQKVTVCHATGSSSNPYVMITVSANALNGLAHAGDFIPAPGATDCSQPTPPPGGGGNPQL